MCVCYVALIEYYLTYQGKHEVVVNTWRPSGFRVLDKLKRCFVGGAPQIDDISYVTLPTDFQVGMKQEDKLSVVYGQTLSDLFCFQGAHLSRYGFRTESSGSVKLCFNIAHQSR